MRKRLLYQTFAINLCCGLAILLVSCSAAPSAPESSSSDIPVQLTEVEAPSPTASLVPAQAPNVLYPALMVDGLLYKWSRKELPNIELTEDDYIGEVISNTSLSEWPSDNGQSNWLRVGEPYARYGAGIVVRHPQQNTWELFEISELPRGIWVLGVLPDERMVDAAKAVAEEKIMQTVLRYEYDGETLCVIDDYAYFQAEFRGFSKGGDVNLSTVDGNAKRFINPTDMIDTNLLKEAWKDNEIFRLVYYWMPDNRTRYFLAVGNQRIVILQEWMTSPNEEFPISPEEVTSSAMLEEFHQLFAKLKGESLVNILETLQ